MTDANLGLRADPVFVGATRPPMRWGVTYSALLANGVLTMEIFLLTKNLLTLGLALPIHGICALLCARDARFFDLALLWGRTRLPALLANGRIWRSSTYSPLVLDPPRPSGRRRPSTVVCEIKLVGMGPCTHRFLMQFSGASRRLPSAFPMLHMSRRTS
jgi:type IV secretion system protein VirB3